LLILAGYAVNSTYEPCLCRQPVTVTSGVHSPSMDNSRGSWMRLTDIQMRTVTPASPGYWGWGDGTRTEWGAAPFITMTLDAAYTDIMGGSSAGCW
jgi:hypothetical protein